MVGVPIDANPFSNMEKINRVKFFFISIVTIVHFFIGPVNPIRTY